MYEIRIILTVLFVLAAFVSWTNEPPAGGFFSMLFTVVAFNISPWQPWF